MSNYRYILERYRGRGTRYTCPQCGRKYTFTRYIDTENNNIYISENVGKCNRLDKCGYHYTPKQYFTDNPWKRDLENWKNIGNFQISKFHTPPPRPIYTILMIERPERRKRRKRRQRSRGQRTAASTQTNARPLMPNLAPVPLVSLVPLVPKNKRPERRKRRKRRQRSRGQPQGSAKRSAATTLITLKHP